MHESEQKDDILIFLRDSKKPGKVEHVSSIVSNTGIEKHKVEMLCFTMKEDDYIVYIRDEDSACKIKDKGNHFLSRGGYTHRHNIDVLRTQQIKTKEDLEIQQLRSVIATNVETQNAFAIQRKQGKITIGIIAVSAIISLVTIVKEVWLSSPAIDKETKQLLQMQMRNIDSIDQSLRRIDSAFEVTLKDSFYQKRR